MLNTPAANTNTVENRTAAPGDCGNWTTTMPLLSVFNSLRPCLSSLLHKTCSGIHVYSICVGVLFWGVICLDLSGKKMTFTRLCVYMHKSLSLFKSVEVI